jgi:triacylglycerol lipase
VSPVYWGCGIARGEGEPVIVVPGLLGTDWYLFEIYRWLRRIGYRSFFSQIGQNADCPDFISQVLLETVSRIFQETGQKVMIVGHSLGGMQARGLALDHPEMISGVISMGSPIRETARVHPFVVETTRRLSERAWGHLRQTCFSSHCSCNFAKNMLTPSKFEVEHFSIYSRTDGVVDWRSCLEEEETRNFEVESTHIGMAFHPHVYQVIAACLAVICGRNF